MNTNTITEFDNIKELWAALAVTQAAKEKIATTSFSLEEREVRKNLKDTTDAKELLVKCGTPPIASVEEAKEVVMFSKQDRCLTPYQLERVEKVLVAVSRLKSYLASGKQYENSIAYYELNLEPMDYLREEIARQIRNEQVDDYASKLLGDIRRDIINLEEKMKQKADQVMKSNKDAMADNFSTIRNGHICIPVKKEYRWKIPGSAIDKSSTGNTIFVEPQSVGNLFEEIALLRLDEENEVHRILYTLTAMVADGSEMMEENIRMIEKLDFFFSKAKLSCDMDGIEPGINLDRKIKLVSARHPLMDKKLSVPLQFELGDGINGVVITGPNTGGKTVAIKTVALNCLMAQCGLHVTCKEADICMSSMYLCDIGDGQNLSENLSTFSAHIKNVLSIIQSLDSDSLVIMDELGSGTDPTEGMGIAIAILEELRKSGCLFLVTTHYPEVKDYALQADRIINARMEFDRETLKPTYNMVIGEAGESCALYIAQKLGMPESMLKVARNAAYGMTQDDCNTEKKPKKFDEKFFTDDQQTKLKASKIKKTKKVISNNISEKFKIGDSVMILPDKKIGIVCEPVNEKGVLRVQVPNKKIYINHKRVKLHVSADQLYPEDYDFSIVFDTVEERKLRHDMDRKYTDAILRIEE